MICRMASVRMWVRIPTVSLEEYYEEPRALFQTL